MAIWNEGKAHLKVLYLAHFECFLGRFQHVYRFAIVVYGLTSSSQSGARRYHLLNLYW